MRVIDLRSDTLTQPTPEMRRAMAEAEVGDDVYGEDPTVNRLEAVLAEMLGFEAALFFPSGTMANQTALLLHAPRASEVLAPEGAHVFEFELAAPAMLAGVLVRPLAAPRGRPSPEAVAQAVHASPHQAPTAALWLENTHNLAGGTVLDRGLTDRLLAAAREKGLKVHLDGARIWNAAVARSEEPATLARGFDTVMVSLSKGLGAPVGSVLLLPQALFAEARRYRKALGGGMRQAGVLAAAGLVALEDWQTTIAADHENARRLAAGLKALGLVLDPEPETNMVYLKHEDAPALVERLSKKGVRALALGTDRVRFVLHKDIAPEDVELALERVEAAL